MTSEISLFITYCKKNIFISGKGECKIGDFGLVRFVDVSSAHVQTTAKGTFRYMAPELWSDSPSYSVKSDLWALGCVLYFMCALKPAVRILSVICKYANVLNTD